MRRVLLVTLAACGGYDDPSDTMDVCGLAETASYPSGPNPSGLVADDLNGDAELDFMIPSEGTQLHIFYGTGNGAFTGAEVPAGDRPTAIAVGDFTEDGRADIAVSNLSTVPSTPTGVSILERRADGSFARLPQLLPIAAFHVVATDFDNDGHLDVVASSTTGVRVFPGTGMGTFAINAPELMLGQTPTFKIADVDGDGTRDLIALSAFKLVVRRSGTTMATSTTNMYDTGGVYPRDLAIGDLDADGDLDLAVANGDNDTVRLFFNTGGSFQTQVDLPTAIPPGSDGASMGSGSGSGSNIGSWLPRNVAIGDFTGDGTSDVLVLIEPYLPTTDASTMLVLERTANGGYQQRPCAMATRPVGVVAGNFFGDARTDAIIVTAPYDARSGGTVMLVQQTP
ncbi:MAG TPA: VCBS repeat-containing protein [Kofleriaceae bacterium]|nr:VCBS repeat-containing protein [Kofleriaceae bacterium]